MAEYYFKTKMKFLRNDLGLDEADMPIIRVEKSYNSNTNGWYVLYAAFPQLYARGKDVVKKIHEIAAEIAALVPFDRIQLRYDRTGVDPEILDKESLEDADLVEIHEGKRPAVSVLDYLKEDYRLEICDDKTGQDLSGIGKITLYKSSAPEKVTELLFVVNFGFKTQISYRITRTEVIFESYSSGKVPVKLLYSADHFPCLKSDEASSNFYDAFDILNFGGKDEEKGKKIKLDIPAVCRGKYLHVIFNTTKHSPSGERSFGDIGDYYTLTCLENQTLPRRKSNHKRPKLKAFCPFCRSPLTAKYKRGGVTCKGKKIKNVGNHIKMLGDDGKAAKACCVCGRDFGTGVFPSRHLPNDWLKRDNFAIAVMGSGRAGKTTFISRLADIKGGSSVVVTGGLLENAMRGRDGRGLCKMKIYPIERAQQISTNVFKATATSWHGAEGRTFYENYVFDLQDGTFPKATEDYDAGSTTETKNSLNYPFIFDVDNSHYVALYDIAGEDSETNASRLGELLANSPLGLFYFIDGEFNVDSAKKVAKQLETILGKKGNRRLPIAVIVSKFDIYADEFNVNCHCLRTDEQDLFGSPYEGSALEQHIELASAEIESFLSDKSLNPFATLGDTEELNYKFFSVTSFSAPESVHRGGGSDEDNYLHFMSAPQRIQLPMIWMLKQFGCII